MGLKTENADIKGVGDLHEAFNLGLDPSLAKASGDRVEGQLAHTDNLWPSTEIWSGAEDFVRYRRICNNTDG